MEQIRKHSRKRDAILSCLRQTCSHPSAEWIYRSLKDEIPDLSLGTVYRNLSGFTETGEAVSLGRIGGQERFDGDTTPHAHFVCRGCGKVTDLPGTETLLKADEIGRVSSGLGAAVESISLLLTGICRECSSKKA